MADKPLQHVTIVGVGLLGGSAALAIKAGDARVKIAGVGRRQSSLDAAMEVGAIDSAHLDAGDVVGKTDLVILATPVQAFAAHLKAIAPKLRRGAVVTDVGSTKARVVASAERILGKGGPFVGSHPMAGSEQKGVQASRADLFTGAACILTPTADTRASVVRRVEAFWRMLGMRTVRMTPAEHDRTLARISHLPHVLASLLMMLPKDADLDVAATGFRDTTRLASGDPEMWRDILTTNRKAVLGAIDKLGRDLQGLRNCIAHGDAARIEQFLAASKKRRDTTVARDPHDRRISAE
jgi:prephenate dehydrogenase